MIRPILWCLTATFLIPNAYVCAQTSDPPTRDIPYELVRNDPSHSGLFGLTLSPAIAECYFLNFNVRGGVGAFYTYKSKFGISIDYQQAYVDDLLGHRKNTPFGTDSYGIPADYKKACLMNVQTKLTLFSWEGMGNYRLNLKKGSYLGERRGDPVGLARGMVLRAVTLRLGGQIDDRIVESTNSGIAFVNSTPNPSYQATNLATSGTMLHSGIITAGLAYSVFKDIKINLKDPGYQGRREEKQQNDLFVDILYAQSLKLGDMVYYYAQYGSGGQHVPQRLDLSQTPLNRVGWRLGYQSVQMHHPHFGAKINIEMGMRPGPQTVDSQEQFYIQAGFGLIFGDRIAG